jgi:hypothetical protein
MHTSTAREMRKVAYASLVRMTMLGAHRGAERTQSQALHHNSLTSEASITVQLNAHHLVAQVAVLGRRLEEGILFCPRFTQRYRIDGLYV